MSKLEMELNIKATFGNIAQKLLLAQLEYLKSGKFYGFQRDGVKWNLTNNKGSYTLEKVI
jgi:hypothetical protein